MKPKLRGHEYQNFAHIYRPRKRKFKNLSLNSYTKKSKAMFTSKYMGVRRLFSRGEQKYSRGGGGKNLLFA